MLSPMSHRYYQKREEEDDLVNTEKKFSFVPYFLTPRFLLQYSSPVYGESNTTIRYLVRDFLWKPVGHKVRFVLVIHPVRGNIILMTTDLTLDPVDVIRTYAQRFKIEVCVQVSNSYYRSILISLLVWKDEANQKRNRYSNIFTENQKSIATQCFKKLHTFHVFIQTAIIAQGILHLLHTSIHFWRVERFWFMARGPFDPMFYPLRWWLKTP